jgi:hypothetical protein
MSSSFWLKHYEATGATEKAAELKAADEVARKAHKEGVKADLLSLQLLPIPKLQRALGERIRTDEAAFLREPLKPQEGR